MIRVKERAKEFPWYGFPGEWKANRKVAFYLWRSYDVPSTEYARGSFFFDFSLFFFFIHSMPSSLSLAHNSQDTSRPILPMNAIKGREGGRKRKKNGRGWRKTASERTPRENSMFFRWRSIITRAQARSISGYFKLLTRRDIPAGGGNFVVTLLGEIWYDRSKTNSSREGSKLERNVVLPMNGRAVNAESAKSSLKVGRKDR